METKVIFSQIREQIIQHINKAEKEIVIAVAWFTDRHIIAAIENKLYKDNIQVKILYYDDKINKKESYRRLYSYGAQIRHSKTMMHNKFCIIDENIVINGSYNWTQNASLNNKENIQISYGDKKLAKTFIAEFNKLFNNAINYKYYIEGCQKTELKIKSNVQAFLPAYRKLFNNPTSYPCIIKILGSTRFKPLYPIFILIKNEKEWDELISALFYSGVWDIVYTADSFEKEVQLEVGLENSTKVKIEDIYVWLSTFDLYIGRYKKWRGKKLIDNNGKDPLLFGVYNIMDESPIFTVNEDLKYCYMYPKDNFLIIWREEKKLERKKYNDPYYESCYTLALMNRYGEVKKEIHQGIEWCNGRFTISCKKEDMRSYRDMMYEYNNRYSEIKSNMRGIQEKAYSRYGYVYRSYIIQGDDVIVIDSEIAGIPIQSIDNHIIICDYDRPCKSYNMINDSGKSVLRYPRDRTHGYICYSIVNRDEIEFLFGVEKSEYNEYTNKDLWNMLYKTTTCSHHIYNLRTKEWRCLEEEEQRREQRLKQYRNSQNCYIATMAYQDINHPKVQLFRQFRDDTLIKVSSINSIYPLVSDSRTL